MKRESCYLLMDTTILSDIPKCLLNTLHEIAPFWTCQNHKCPLCRILLTRVLICSLQTSRLPQTQAVCVMVKWPFHRHVGLPCPTKGSCGAEWPNCSSCSLHRCMVIVGFVSWTGRIMIQTVFCCSCLSCYHVLCWHPVFILMLPVGYFGETWNRKPLCELSLGRPSDRRAWTPKHLPFLMSSSPEIPETFLQKLINRE